MRAPPKIVPKILALIVKFIRANLNLSTPVIIALIALPAILEASTNPFTSEELESLAAKLTALKANLSLVAGALASWNAFTIPRPSFLKYSTTLLEVVPISFNATSVFLIDCAASRTRSLSITEIIPSTLLTCNLALAINFFCSMVNLLVSNFLLTSISSTLRKSCALFRETPKILESVCNSFFNLDALIVSRSIEAWRARIF